MLSIGRGITVFALKGSWIKEAEMPKEIVVKFEEWKAWNLPGLNSNQ
jgi:hypothetical protein